MNEDKMTLEEKFAHIQEILNQLESGQSSLDQSFELYKEGLNEIKACNEMLDTVEKAMLVLNQEGELEEF